jgi:hypothetical protein
MGRDVRQCRVSHKVTDHFDVHDGKLVVRGAKDGDKLVISGESQDAAGFTHVVFKDREFRILADGVTHTVLHKGSTFSLTGFTMEDETKTRLEPGAMLRAGDSFTIADSPNPIALVDSSGSLVSRNMWSVLFDPYVLGNADSSVPTRTFAQGLVRAGQAFDTSDPGSATYLRHDGQWASLTTDGVTGSVAANLLSLDDVPDHYSGKNNAFLRVHPTSGSVIFDTAVTSDAVSEGASNLFYTNDRVTQHCASGSLGVVKCQEVLVLSDERAKTAITPLDDEEALDTVVKMQPKKYEYKSEPGRERTGLIAQELPDKYTVKGEDGMLRVSFYDILASLIGSIKALSTKADQLGD